MNRDDSMTLTLRRLLAASVSAYALVCAAPVSAAPVCASSSEIATLDARALQTELMVAALTCKQSKQYNAFVTARKKELASNATDLRGYFQRLHGSKSESRLNAFITSLANQVSRRSMGRPLPQYCAETAALFNAVSDPKKPLATIAAPRQYASAHGQKPCAQVAAVSK